MSFPAQAQTTNICDRTQQVQDAILSNHNITADSCTSVRVSEMRKILTLSASSRNITTLKRGDFDGLPNMDTLRLDRNGLTELSNEIFSNNQNLLALYLQNNSLMTLSSDVFSNLPFLVAIFLDSNQLRILPDNIFSGLTKLVNLRLVDNPNSPFQLQVHLQASVLGTPESFTVGAIRLVMPVGAPRSVTVSVAITGGTPEAGSLTIPAGGVESARLKITRTEENFHIRTGEITLSGNDDNFTGFDIVEGSRLSTIFSTALRVRVFLEGALE